MKSLSLHLTILSVLLWPLISFAKLTEIARSPLGEQEFLVLKVDDQAKPEVRTFWHLKGMSESHLVDVVGLGEGFGLGHITTATRIGDEIVSVSLLQSGFIFWMNFNLKTNKGLCRFADAQKFRKAKDYPYREYTLKIVSSNRLDLILADGTIHYSELMPNGDVFFDGQIDSGWKYDIIKTESKVTAKSDPIPTKAPSPTLINSPTVFPAPNSPTTIESIESKFSLKWLILIGIMIALFYVIFRLLKKK